MTEWSELIFGSMYCGKSEELIRRLKRLKIAGKNIQLFKPAIDNRYDLYRVVTHDNNELRNKLSNILQSIIKHNVDNVCKDIIGEMSGSMNAIPVHDSTELLSQIKRDTEIVGIDEVQFFDMNLLKVIDELNQRGIRVIMAGLDMYASGEPWGVVPFLASKAKYVDKLHAVCVDCGEDAYISYLLEDQDKKSKIQLGSKDVYIALCEDCASKRDNRR